MDTSEPTDCVTIDESSTSADDASNSSLSTTTLSDSTRSVTLNSDESSSEDSNDQVACSFAAQPNFSTAAQVPWPLVDPRKLVEPSNNIVFCMVPARLCLLNSNKRLPVTLAEIHRRINPPECINQSLLSAVLRKAKNRDGGSKLSNHLRYYNIFLPQGRRKSVPNTSFTALCEAEALKIAQDFNSLSSEYFPFASMAYEYLKNCSGLDDFRQKKQAIWQAMSVVNSFMAILHHDRSPVCNMSLNQEIFMHPESQKSFSLFSLLTHGFGGVCHSASWMTLEKCLNVTYRAFENPVEFCTTLGREYPPWIVAENRKSLQNQNQQREQSSQQN